MPETDSKPMPKPARGKLVPTVIVLILFSASYLSYKTAQSFTSRGFTPGADAPAADDPGRFGSAVSDDSVDSDDPVDSADSPGVPIAEARGNSPGPAEGGNPPDAVPAAAGPDDAENPKGSPTEEDARSVSAASSADAPIDTGNANEPTPPEAPENGEGSSPDSPEAEGPGFDFELLETMAKTKAREPFVPKSPGENLFSGLDEETWRSISHDPRHWLWSGNDGSFELSLFHPGFIYDQSVAINVLEGGKARRLEYDAEWFLFPDPALKEEAQRRSPGFAGFALRFPRNESRTKTETVIFLGANHFQAAARHSGFGETARAIAINPALPEGEEFAWFREFWLAEPEEGETGMVVLALLESQSLVGAYEFRINPGSSMSMGVRASIFRRADSPWPEKLGLAPVSGMYLYSEKENGSPGDWRPELHGTDGLLYSDGPDGWHLRVLNNPKRLATSTFVLQKLAGYGLIQRDNDFDHYQDILRRYDLRTWIWVEPEEPFPFGTLELMEIPGSKEIHDNILAFWSVAGKDLETSEGFNLSYNLFFMPPASNPHTLGRVTAARISKPDSADFVEFHVDFENSFINSITEVEGLASVVETGGRTPVLEKNLHKNPVTGGWRLELRVKAPESP
ncbi:MAG: glucan biosynthesis protein, partial [Deltaproteobacteria bacterium]|nr:glucan biosynthesis protein [Deltaproteobacteria bacterium]